jgi:hypothetical protein
MDPFPDVEEAMRAALAKEPIPSTRLRKDALQGLAGHVTWSELESLVQVY